MGRRVEVDISEIADLVEDITQEFLLEVANELVNELKKEAPSGATGDLVRLTQIWQQEPGKIIITMPDHAQFVIVETSGSAPGLSVPFEPIHRWARRKLGASEDEAWAIWRSIDESGTDANPFISRAIDNTLQQFQ